MPSFDTRVPAVLLRLDRNPFHHGTLGAVRSLGRAGIEVHAVVEAADSPVTRSRYLREAHPRPGDTTDLAGIQRLLTGIADRLAIPAVLLAMDDLSAIAVGRLRPALRTRYLLPEQPSGLPERVADKAELVGICAELGVPHPETVVPGSAAEAAAAAWALGLPVVAKWSRPWLLPEGAGLRSTQVLRSSREARELYGRSAEAGSGLLLQRFLPPGRDLDWFFHGYSGRDGTCLVGAAGRKERSWPVGAGLTAVGRWLSHPEVERTARQLVAALGYRGILDLDFRQDAATGAYHLLDFNPRPGAQFRLFTDGAGTDVVRAQHLDLTGRAVPAPVAAYGRTFVVENYALLSALASRGASAGDFPGAGSFPGACAGREAAWWARDDWRPAAAMAGAWVRHGARRGGRRLLRGRAAGAGAAAGEVVLVRQRRGGSGAPARPPVPLGGRSPDGFEEGPSGDR
ncbi:ATP-grasp domain-containing protein [Streptomyces liangshanensis]|uniref:ATP-grasp domain-containing protein n=1 Tax=Streptomyces liangshanensis TaxID=2717324 RepID=A0A6G9H1C2_9ACTN|nr:ATP-grasp domain-containing protein [Streptomyces liangshanensis]QIQ04342.1 ATP-grasp domain-containing protein [Streptomyces liangshanensis]